MGGGYAKVGYIMGSTVSLPHNAPPPARRAAVPRRGAARPSKARGAPGVAAMAATMILPVVMSIGGAAAEAKIAFPVLATLLALWLSRTAPARYVVFTLLVFMLAPGLRHFVDWYAGYSRTNAIVLAPYCLVLTGFPACLLYMMNRRPYTVVFTAMLLTILLALRPPFLHGNIQPGLLTLVYWVCPVIFGVYILAHAEHLADMQDAVGRTFRIALPLMAGYALWQYVAIPPWDAYFMKSAGPINAMGYPEPFQVRVFGAMNSPGALATMLATGILLTVPTVRGIGWLGIVAALGALLLTTQRAAFGGAVLGILVLLVVTRDAVLRGSLLRLAATAVLTGLIVLALPEAGGKVAGSFASLGNLDRDDSARQRLAQYQAVPQWLADEPLGRGLGWSQDPAYVRVGTDILTDSGIIDGFITLGVPGGLLFFATLGILFVATARIALTASGVNAGGGNAGGLFAAVVFGVSYLPFGGQQTGVPGVFLYLCVGLLLAGDIAAALGTAPRMPGASG